ncbi:hypothetical protein FF2_013662 [Malus domestica]
MYIIYKSRKIDVESLVPLSLSLAQSISLSASVGALKRNNGPGVDTDGISYGGISLRLRTGHGFIKILDEANEERCKVTEGCGGGAVARWVFVAVAGEWVMVW